MQITYSVTILIGLVGIKLQVHSFSVEYHVIFVYVHPIYDIGYRCENVVKSVA